MPFVGAAELWGGGWCVYACVCVRVGGWYVFHVLKQDGITIYLLLGVLAYSCLAASGAHLSVCSLWLAEQNGRSR